ncbi:MAG TPA: SpoIVB peptidase S55 domain-containing protein [Candidatus Acidoferrales bacterium]
MPVALRSLLPKFLAALILLTGLSTAKADDTPVIFPLSQIQPGMKCVVYTIFTGDEIETVDLVVLGVLHNAIGPKQDIILVQLLGEKVEHTGVVAGMSGSPVYYDGKLVGALSLKLGAFTKEAIGGVTPIENMLDVEKAPEPAAIAPPPASAASAQPTNIGNIFSAPRIPLPENFARQTSAGSGQFLVPIETPLISTGLYPETIAQFSKQLSAWGMTMMAGGTAAPSSEDAQLKPGDMVGVELIRGDLSITPGCTVTTVDHGKILACGHPIFSFGNVSMPLARAHVLTTLASAMASTKIITTGGTIGTLTQDRVTAIAGHLGDGPPMIPVDVTLVAGDAQKQFHFEVIESPQLTPVLVALATYNGIVGNAAYGEGSTLQLDGEIAIKGHTTVALKDLFAPTDVPVPGGFFVATDVQGIFAQIYSNPYEIPHVAGIHLRVTALPLRRAATIDDAWVEANEVRPGQTVNVKVQLRPYRGATFVQEFPITIPMQAARGPLQLVISDAETVNRTVQSLAASSQGQLPGLEELIKLMNRAHQNDRLYATLLQPTPTLMVEDKVMPNAPASAINVLDQRQSPGGARLLYQSTAGEWSVEMHQVISGERTLTVTVK